MILSMSPRARYTQTAAKIIRILKFEGSRGGSPVVIMFFCFKRVFCLGDHTQLLKKYNDLPPP